MDSYIFAAYLILSISVVGFSLEVIFTCYKRWKYKGMGSIEMIDGVIYLNNIRMKNVTTYLDPEDRVVFTNIRHNMDLRFIKRGE